MMKRALGKKNVFAFFSTFGRYVTNLRGTFVANVKKVQNQPTLLCPVPMHARGQLNGPSKGGILLSIS
jgi:hypothetical protein